MGVLTTEGWKYGGDAEYTVSLAFNLRIIFKHRHFQTMIKTFVKFQNNGRVLRD